MCSLVAIKCSNILDVGCMCHMADLAVKTGMEELSVDIGKLFIDVFYYFIIVAKGNKSFVTFGAPSLLLKNPNHCPTHWLSLLCCVGRYILNMMA